jgi:hypothetical protein
LSARLVELARFYLDGTESPRFVEAFFTMAGVAWNLASRPKREREVGATRMAVVLEAAHADVVRGILMKLIRRKLRLFPTDHRLILGCSFSWTGDQVHVTVASADLDDADPAPATGGHRSTGGRAPGLPRGARG